MEQKTKITTNENENAPQSTIKYLPTEEIMPNRAQPRKTFDNASLWQLAESIKKHGILQPITVKKCEDSSEYSIFQYELIAGERRLRAARLIGLTTIPCILLNIGNKESAELAIIENLHRENLNIFEEAAAIASLIDLHKLTQEEIASQLSLTQSAIANKLRLLRLTDAERTVIITNNLSERHARALLRIKNPIDRIEALAHIVGNSMNVKQSEQYIERLISPETDKIPPEKDYKTHINTIQKAIYALRSLGSGAKTSCSETDTELIYTITIAKQTNQSNDSSDA